MSLTPSQVATRFDVCVETVRAWITSGELRATNVSRNQRAKRKTFRIEESDLREFQESRKNAAPSRIRERSIRSKAPVLRFIS